MKTIPPEFTTKLEKITSVSKKTTTNDTHTIITMMKDHIKEISERYNNSDDHWSIETTDLIILCYDLLLMEHKDIDDVFDRCLPRFDTKLKRLADHVP